MKANTHIAIGLMGIVFGFTTLNAQTVRRTTEEKKRTTTAQRSTARQSDQRQVKRSATVQKPQRATARQATTRQTTTRQNAPRQVQRTTNVRKPQNATARNNNPRQVQRTTNVRKPQNATARNNAPRQVQRTTTRTATTHRPTSVSNDRNPRSTYRAPERNRHAKAHVYKEKRYYSGHHYHQVYPKHKVKVHFHHDTYRHHYHVLYRPAYHEVYWNRNMYRDYRRWYPNYRWDYHYGNRIHTISIFDARYRLGEVANVYGRVYATWHNRETDDYLLFFGGDYPNQEFTIVLPGHIARKYSWRPERYFLGEHLMATGLITTYDGNPEIIVKNKRQLDLY